MFRTFVKNKQELNSYKNIKKIIMKINGKNGIVNIMIDDVEQEALNQLYKISSSHIGSSDIVIMPDVHAGKGCVVGFTQPLLDVISPNIIGVDIGCGLLGFELDLLDIENKEEIDNLVREYVPTGHSVHEKIDFHFSEIFNWKNINETVNKFTTNYNKKFNTNFKAPLLNYGNFISLCLKCKVDFKRVVNSIGTLGGGNHFIEFNKSEKTGNIWCFIHSGSRNLGKMICEYHVDKAKRYIDGLKKSDESININEIKKHYSGSDIQKQIQSLKSKSKFDYDTTDLEYLTGEQAYEYYVDMLLAVEYAKLNRLYIKKNILKSFKNTPKVLNEIESIHNFIDLNDFIIRKGSIRSYKGEKMIIPFNMRDGILICEGKSNPEWNCSAPHGAGRVLSRSAAKNFINLEDFQNTMNGIYSTSVCVDTLDESPFAYKDCEIIEMAIEPTATILDKLKPIINIKDRGKNDKYQ